VRRLGVAVAEAGASIGGAWSAALERVPVPSRWLPAALILWVFGFSLWNVSTVGRIPPFWAAGDPPSASMAAHISRVDALLARIPADASVCATDTLDPHLSDRYDLYLAPDPQCYQAGYVAMDLPAAVASVRPADTQMLRRMETSGRYQVVGQAGDVILLRLTGAPLAP
jgi:hypothetical protein